MRSTRKRRWLAGSLGTGLVLLLLLIAYLDTLGDADGPERVVLTDVTTYQAPPPPPPPPRPRESRSGGSTGAFLPLDTSRAPVLDVMQLDVQFAARIGELNLGGLGQGIGVGSGDGTGDGTGMGFGLATLAELDQVPMVVSAPVFPYPDEASARGLGEFDLRYAILIDEEGRVYPIALIQNPFPSSNAEFLEWASRVRFSPPTRLGIPVRTEYQWPVKIKR